MWKNGTPNQNKATVTQLTSANCLNFTASDLAAFQVDSLQARVRRHTSYKETSVSKPGMPWLCTQDILPRGTI